MHLFTSGPPSAFLQALRPEQRPEHREAHSPFESPVIPEENLLIHWDMRCLERLPECLRKFLNDQRGLDEEERDEQEIRLFSDHRSHPHSTQNLQKRKDQAPHSSNQPLSRLSPSSSLSRVTLKNNQTSSDPSSTSVSSEEDEEASLKDTKSVGDSTASFHNEEARVGRSIVYRRGVFYTEFPPPRRGEERKGLESQPQEKSREAAKASSTFSSDSSDMSVLERRGRSLALSILAGALGVRTPAQDTSRDEPRSSGDRSAERKGSGNQLELKKEEEEGEADKNSSPEVRRCNDSCQRELERLFRSRTEDSMHATFYPLFSIDIIRIKNLPKIRKVGKTRRAKTRLSVGDTCSERLRNVHLARLPVAANR